MTDPFERAVNSELVEHARRGFRIHLFVYVAVHVLLFAIWAGPGNVGDALLPWPVYSLLGWGIGLVAHYMALRPASRSRPPSA